MLRVKSFNQRMHFHNKKPIQNLILQFFVQPRFVVKGMGFLLEVQPCKVVGG